MRLPVELLYGVMKQLDSHVRGRTFLFRAMQVNKTWFGEASRVLWRAPPVSALASPELSEDQRRKYATYIRRLHFAYYEDTILHWTFRNLRFTQLRYIDIDHSVLAHGPNLPLGQYIQGQLRHLKLRRGSVHHVEGVVDLMATRCPNLGSVDLSFIIWRPACEHLIRLFDDKSLKSIHLAYYLSGPIDRDLVAYLTRYDSLEKLKISAAPLDAQSLNGVFNTNEQLFRNIRYLELEIDVTYVQPLVRSIKPARNLIELHLNVKGDSVNPLPYVSELRSLRVLCIKYRELVPWSKTDILALRGLENLLILRILFHSRGVVDATLECPQLTDQDFAYVFQTKPFLRELNFGAHIIRCNLTVEALVSLGTYCRQLRVCKFPGVYGLHRLWQGDDEINQGRLNGRSILFPQLQNLTVIGILPVREV